MPAVYEFPVSERRAAGELDPATADLARRVQAATRLVEGREVDDDTAIAMAKVIDGSW